jgi:hypothetical protein
LTENDMKYSRTRDAEAKARPAAVDAKPGPWRKPVKNNDFSCKPAAETGENLPPRRGCRQVLPVHLPPRCPCGHGVLRER